MTFTHDSLLPLPVLLPPYILSGPLLCLTVFMWTCLSTFVFQIILDSASVPAPGGQLDHQPNYPGIQYRLRAWLITVFIECQLTKEQLTSMYKGSQKLGSDTIFTLTPCR